MLWAALLPCACNQPEEPRLTSFLHDPPPMVRIGSGPGITYAWFNPHRRVSNYYNYIIEPVAVDVQPGVSEEDMRDADLNRLAQFFREEMTRQLLESGKYQIVDQAGEGVLRVRTAITGVKPNKPGWNQTNVTRLTGIGLGSASMEGEIIDTFDGQRVLTFVVYRPANRFSLAATSEWGSTEEILAYWALRLRQAADNRWISERSVW
jgi:hypothetical protein